MVPRAPVHIRVGKAPLLGHRLESGVGTASWCVEGYRTPDEAMVC